MDKIKLLPSNFWGGLKKQLIKSLTNSTRVRGCVAYWTIFPDFFPELSQALQKNGSYYIVDLRLPTNVDALAGFVEEGAEIYLFHPYLKTQVQEGSTGLLHAKMLLLDNPKNDAELFIGSHNMTKRALNAVNIETSLKIETTTTSNIYYESDIFLETLKTGPNVIKFDLAKIAYYKRLQGIDELEEDEEEVYVIRIIGERILELPDERMFQILSSNRSDIEKTRTAFRTEKIIVQAFDIETEKEYLFWGQIPQSGILDKDNAKSIEITFGQRRIAKRVDEAIPILENFDRIDKDILEQFGFFANVEILGLCLNTESEIIERNPTPASYYEDIPLREMKAEFVRPITYSSFEDDDADFDVFFPERKAYHMDPYPIKPKEIMVKRIKATDSINQKESKMKSELGLKHFYKSARILRMEISDKFIKKVFLRDLIESNGLSKELQWYPLVQKKIKKGKDYVDLDYPR